MSLFCSVKQEISSLILQTPYLLFRCLLLFNRIQLQYLLIFILNFSLSLGPIPVNKYVELEGLAWLCSLHIFVYLTPLEFSWRGGERCGKGGGGEGQGWGGGGGGERRKYNTGGRLVCWKQDNYSQVYTYKTSDQLPRPRRWLRPRRHSARPPSAAGHESGAVAAVP
jgi:hypothetical protein